MSNSNNGEKLNKEKGLMIISRTWIYALLAVYGCCLFYLYYNQTQYFLTQNFESDLPFHLKFAVEDRFFYSFTTFLYLLFSKFSCFHYLVAISLTVVSVLTIFATEKLLEKVFVNLKVTVGYNVRLLLSFALNMVLAFYVPWAGKSHYVAYQSGNLWHNSTYIFMKLFAVLTILVWLDFYESYKEKITAKEWLKLSLLLMITTGIKASFFTVFGLVMAIYLLIDLIKKTKFIKVFVAALTVVPSMIVIVLQSMLLFSDESGNGYIIKPFYTLSLRGEHPKVTVILSVLFPLIICAGHLKEIFKSKLLTGTVVMYLIGFTEVFLLAETGARAKDGNFLWGYSISIFVIFVMSVALLIKDTIGLHNTKAELPKKTVAVKTGGLTVAYLILLWHLVSGIWYFALLLTGVTYFV